MLATQVVWVPATNFTGFDEWLIIDLVSRGIIDIPHGNRPVHLLWLSPAALGPHNLTPYVLLHAGYSFVFGFTVFLLCRRLIPGSPLLWLLTAVLSIVWGPGDLARLSTIERTGYTAFACGMVLALWLLVESWRLGSPSVLAFAILVAFLVARSYEAVVPLLACAPVVLLLLPGGRRSHLRTWIVAWEAVIGLVVLLVTLPMLVPNGLMKYQTQVLGLDRSPGHVAVQLFWQYAFHLAPVVLSAPSELAVGVVPVAVSVFVALVAVWAWLVRETPACPEPRVLYARNMLAGGVWAGLGYGVLLLVRGEPTGLRMQFLSAPGIALLLASAACLVATLLPRRWRLAATTLMVAWVVAVGTGRTVAMQKKWDALSMYRTQMRMLGGLTREVPDLRPHTLLVLLDEGHAWRASYGFLHAVHYLYEGRAIGIIPGGWQAPYPAFFSNRGVRVEPWPVLRRPWRTEITLHAYEEVVVVRDTPGGDVQVLVDWPPQLPPLPGGARYAPRSRIVRGGPLPPERAILDRGASTAAP